MLSFDTNQIRTVASNLENYSGEFQTKLSNINKINQDMKNNWQGVAADSYIKAIEEQYSQMSKLTETISGIATYLNNLAKAAEELENSNMASGSNQ